MGNNNAMTNNKELIKIREASLEDLDKLIDLKILYEKEESRFSPPNDFWRMNLDRQALAKDIKTDLRKGVYFFVAETGAGELIGFSTAFMEEDLQLSKVKKVCKLAELFVLPEYRGRGIASKLMQSIFEVCKSKTRNVILHVSPNNYYAISIYKRLGFNLSYICLGKKCLGKKVGRNKRVKMEKKLDKDVINYELQSAKMKDLDLLVEQKMRAEENKARGLPKNHLWQPDLNKRKIKQYLLNRIRSKKTKIYLLKSKEHVIGYLIATINRMPQIMKVKEICKIEDLAILSKTSSPEIILQVLLDYLLRNSKAQYFTVHVLPQDHKRMLFFEKNGFGPSYLCFSKRI